MSQCPRCGRVHSGVCGIPRIGVRIGIGGVGARTRTTSSGGESRVPARFRPPRRRPTTGTLEGLLAWGEAEYQKVIALLKQMPPEMPEYPSLLDREAKLAATLQQVKGQLAQRRG